MTKDLVRLDNTFALEAQYKLTLAQQKIFFALVAKIDPKKDTFFEEIELSFAEIKNILAGDAKAYKSLYSMSKDLTSRLIKTTLSFPTDVVDNGQNLEGHISFFRSITPRYNKHGEKVLGFLFNDILEPFLLHLNEYVKINRLQVVNMKSNYSIRIYTMLKALRAKSGKHKKKSYREWSVQELQATLGIEEKKYKRFYDFEKYVIKRATKEINEKTDIKIIDIEKIKERKKTVGLVFVFTDQEKPKETNQTQIPFTKRRGERIPRPEEQQAKEPTEAETDRLTYSQYKAYKKLKDYGINTRFIINTMLDDINTMGEEMRGYEDIFLQFALRKFHTKTKAKKPEARAGIFVNWWKKKTNFTDELSVSKYREQLRAYKKEQEKTDPNAAENRNIAKGKPHKEALQIIKEMQKLEEEKERLKTEAPTTAEEEAKKESMMKLQSVGVGGGSTMEATVKRKAPFTMKLFRELYPNKLNEIKEQTTADYKEQLQGVDEEKTKRMIDNRVFYECEQYYNSSS